MDVSNKNTNLSAEHETKFRLIALLNNARSSGLAYVASDGCDIQKMKDSIASINAQLSELEQSGVTDYLSENSPIYLNAKKRALEESIEVCQTFNSDKNVFQLSSRVLGGILYLTGLISDSRRDAHEFAIECNGDLEAIKAEIEKHKSYIYKAPPISSVRCYHRFMVPHLQEIYEFLEAFKEREE
ncbi:MAG: hypothetical protein OEZ02_06455 [Anaerolineae bacterium]|nr:hypothetical protein [Anaerolineae bacterium]